MRCSIISNLFLSPLIIRGKDLCPAKVGPKRCFMATIFGLAVFKPLKTSSQKTGRSSWPYKLRRPMAICWLELSRNNTTCRSRGAMDRKFDRQPLAKPTLEDCGCADFDSSLIPWHYLLQCPCASCRYDVCRRDGLFHGLLHLFRLARLYSRRTDAVLKIPVMALYKTAFVSTFGLQYSISNRIFQSIRQTPAP